MPRQRDLFRTRADRDMRGAPLAERMRPRSIDEIEGQSQIIGEGRLLRQAIDRDELPSVILWGPPGTGKTTLARVIARHTQARFEPLSAVLAGVKDIRAAVAEAEQQLHMHSRRTILFIDEIHRFNKAQQDALLPHVERGTVILIGATTENPSFEVNAALLSRMKVFVLEALSEEALLRLLRRALEDTEHGLGGQPLSLEGEPLEQIARESWGDARRALGTLEAAAAAAREDNGGVLTEALVTEAQQRRVLLYDKSGEEHYNVVSAFIKSMRGSDPDAAVYWMMRMLESGEEPRFVFRRMVIFASEDVGNADPRALQVAIDAFRSFELVGMPEGVLPLTQAATYLACAPKSNAVLQAYVASRKDVREHGPLPVPPRLRNAPTRLMKDMGYGAAYRYPHNFEGSYVPERYMPAALEDRRYYDPRGAGDEAPIKERLDGWRQALENPEPPGED